ncbi:transporter substrate-binding domain-containing protein [Sulfidibacter corallicola]|uniref:histidine kinase n=1 Tax=Sulfidibacter corallicola TaxID=2818388 RepID=A0A8A4TIU7_SULCO|nr:transporter substrate-binding domain-containing protein [Sulfidibacter corallicola]QTD49846.1 transporter substrate-binding domain-containing protein [Sulfidibacter corallicola]
MDSEGIPLSYAEREWLANHRDSLLVAVERYYPPYLFVDEQGEIHGVSADYLRLLERELDLRFRFSDPLEFPQIIAGAKQGRFDIVTSITHMDSRAEYLNFTDPYISLPAVIITRADAGTSLEIANLEAMRVGSAKSFAVTEHLRTVYPTLDLIETDSDMDGLRMVAFGEVDAYVADLGTVSYLIEKEGLGNLRVAGDVDFSYHFGMASRKDQPMLHAILTKAMRHLEKREGSAIYSRWISLRLPSIYQSPLFRIVLPMFAGMVTLILLWNLSLRRVVRMRTAELREEIGVRVRAEEDLQQAHDELEERVKRRTAQLHDKNDELQREIADRTRAQEELAMAREIANCTVHNIGNVVNSLVVGSQSLRRVMEQSRLPSLLRGLALLEQHRQHLATFLVEDERGRKLPDFLSLAGEDLDRQRERMECEMEELTKQIGLIREVARTQQTFAVERSGECRLDEVLDDALKIQFSGRAARTIEIERDYAFTQLVPYPRTKLAHVFLNLIKNAREAMASESCPEPKLFLGIELTDDRRVKVSFCDNGVGIGPENLKKLGTYGFTTKREGHGFGVKYCMETVKAMGGTMEITSEGADRGSCFAIFLPLETHWDLDPADQSQRGTAPGVSMPPPTVDSCLAPSEPMEVAEPTAPN